MLRILYLICALGLGAGYYYLLGAGPEAGASEVRGEWWQPGGWLLSWTPASPLFQLIERPGPARLIPVYLFWLPAIAVAMGGMLLFRSALMRVLFCWLGLTLCSFTYYGLFSQPLWRAFEWRLPAALAGLSLVLSVLLFGPALLQALTRLPRVLAALLLLGLFAAVFLLQTEITGTDPELPFSISLWPVLTVFGMLYFGYALAAIHLAAGAGLWLSARVGGARGRIAGACTAAALAAAGSFFVWSDPDLRAVAGFALLAAGYALLARELRSDEQSGRSAGAATAMAGLLIAVMIAAGDRGARLDQAHARDDTSHALLLALEEYRGLHDAYPERLEDLVPGQLAEIPRPAIGLIRNEGDAFGYANFGDSYALEFASAKWVQCVYSRPAAGPEPEIDVAAGPPGWDPAQEALREAGLEGSWNCPTHPSRIW